MEIESTGSWRLEPCKDVPPKDQGLDPRKVGQWIESLPLADTERLANTLIEAFRAWNAMCITPARRFQLLEDLRKQVGLAVEQLEGRFLRDDFPLPAREQGLARLARTLLDVFGQGYERVHLDLVGQGGIGGWWKRRYQRVAIHRAMSYLNRVLLACYQTYSPFPRNIWWEVHRLYTDALSANCADTVVEDDYHQFVWRTSVSDRYKQILLLALSNPDQMRPKVVRDLYGVLESLAALAKLGVPVNGKVGGAFLVLSPVDKGPQCACDSHTPVDREAFLLDTVDLEEELARWRRKASGRRVATEQNRVPLDSLSVEVVDRMIHAWGLRARRSMNRIHSHSEVWVLPGFHRIYAMLQSRLKQESGGSSDTEENLVTEVGSAWRGKSTSAINEVHPILCKVIDQSACGYRLMWPADAGVGVSMGGLIALRWPEEGNGDREPWAIGVVRRFHMGEDAGLQLGVQMLASEPEIGTILQHKEGQNVEEPALVLPPVHALHLPPSLVIPRQMGVLPQEVELRSRRYRGLVDISVILEHTEAFHQVRHRPATGEQDESARGTLSS